MSTDSPVDEEEKEVEEKRGDKEYDKSEGENEGELEGEDDEDEDESDRGASVSGSPGDGRTRPFILPKMWIVNDFKLTMTANVFKNLKDHYQIPDNIPICLPGKFEKCYSGKIADVGMYDAMFPAELRLPLTALHCQLANFLGLSVNQIAPNV